MQKGDMTVLDWEMADSGYPPWFDATHNILMLALQPFDQGIVPDIEASLAMTLSPETWTGRVTRKALLDGWRWPLPVSWALLLTAMKTTLRRGAAGRPLPLRWGHAVVELLTSQQLGQKASWATLNGDQKSA
jgi:hypothetical protein